MHLRLLHLLLIICLFFGSGGLAFSKHYCKSELVGVGIWLPAEDCHDNPQRHHCELDHDQREHQYNAQHKDCCNDQTQYVQTVKDLYVKLAEGNNDFVVLPAGKITLPDVVLVEQYSPDIQLPPSCGPPVGKSAHVWFQIFRL